MKLKHRNNETINIMEKHIVCLFMLSFALITANAQSLKKASPEQSKKMLETVEKNVSAVKSIQCEFQQVKSVSLLNDKIVSKGKMYFSNGKLRWEYTTPYSYIFIVNGQEVLIKSNDKTRKIDAQSSQMFKKIAQLIANTVSGANLSQNSDFTVEMYTLGTKYVAKLIPKQAKMKKMFNGITLYFNDNKNLVEKIEINEASGDKTTITILNPKTNLKISDSIFSI